MRATLLLGPASADLPLGPAVIEPREQAGGMTATDHQAETSQKALAWQASFRVMVWTTPAPDHYG
ncbi:hypothetical protein CHELA1G11_10100 [Hyphomicrobiales bacterium]|nr:hypothetical protein CHELA1G11_10100 [Hyphomicrobiales bacterium]CAH1677069.1 hypothetical protein CHELA1G2_14209 [Hyphomicrobiales bacterium]